MADWFGFILSGGLSSPVNPLGVCSQDDEKRESQKRNMDLGVDVFALSVYLINNIIFHMWKCLGEYQYWASRTAFSDYSGCGDAAVRGDLCPRESEHGAVVNFDRFHGNLPNTKRQRMSAV